MIVPIFPLPDVVLFPRTVLPLHIFEERYREMVRSALAGDAKIAVVLLRRGWEGHHGGKPAVHEIACLGKIETYEELVDGKYNILLSGVQRVRLLREIEHSPYRIAEAEPLQDILPDDKLPDIVRRRNHLAAAFIRFTELIGEAGTRSKELVPRLDFEALVNTVASTLEFPPGDKQALLELSDVVQRCDVLMQVLQVQLEALIIVRKFENIKPMDPSRN
jgi:Lon protease-like protein